MAATMKPSWQDYVDNALLSSGYLTKAAIVGLDKGLMWANSRGFQVSALEVKAAIKAFTEPDQFVLTGLELDSKKYTLVKSTPTFIIGKCCRGGCIIAKSRRLLIFTVWEENAHSGSAVNLVAKLTDYLRHKNF